MKFVVSISVILLFAQNSFAQNRDPRCPISNDPSGVTLLPHADCTKYYTCDWGYAIERPCPDGLHFNPWASACDWPWEAGCDPSQPTLPGQTTSTSLPPVSTLSQDVTVTDQPPIDPRCPSQNDPSGVTLLPHQDCTKFYMCDWGRAHQRSCPDNLHFNPQKNACDWAWEAGCDPSQTAPPGVGTTSQTTSSPGGGQTTSSPGGGQTTNSLPPVTTSNFEVTATSQAPIDPRCPSENNPSNVVHLPHESYCTMFYICDWGRAVLLSCPDDLHFNRQSDKCDWPWEAGCDSTQTTPPDWGVPSQTTSAPGGGVTTSTGGGGSVPPVTTVSQEVTVTGQPPIDPRCPQQNDPNKTVHLPHEYDCTLFYKCNWGRVELQNCPHNLHFNPISSVCDHPEQAGCNL